MTQYSIPLEADRVQITDELFGSYLRNVAETIIPYQWDALNDRLPDMEKSHCIDNFRAAAGELACGHQGGYFPGHRPV